MYSDSHTNKTKKKDSSQNNNRYIFILILKYEIQNITVIAHKKIAKLSNVFKGIFKLINNIIYPKFIILNRHIIICFNVILCFHCVILLLQMYKNMKENDNFL